MIIEGFCGQIRVQFARFSVHSGSVIVVDAIGKVAALLHFGQQNAGPDGVNTAGRNIEHVARMHLVAGQYVGDSAIGDALFAFGFIDFAVEPHVKISAGIS